MSIWTILLGDGRAKAKPSPAVRPALEPLEPRLLLDVNWTDPETSLALDSASALPAIIVEADSGSLVRNAGADAVLLGERSDALVVSKEALAVPREELAQPLASPPVGAAPYGAAFLDTSEYMIGDVWVTLVLLESNGSIDPSTENWTPAEINQVKAEVQEGLTWWQDTFLNTLPGSPCHLTFHLDTTYADNPVPTQYEPIIHPARGWDEGLWINDFLNYVGYNSSAGYLTDLYQWDHDQRVAHNTEWAYTVFVVDSSADADGQFSNPPSLAWTYVGGPLLYMTYDNGSWGIDNMGEVLAHETAHIFYALDESPTAGSYTDHSGYYNTQNLNAYSGNPDPSTRVASMMTSNIEEKPLMDAAYANHTSSPSSLEMIGWKDSDGDRIPDVLDVPLTLDGTASYNTGTGQWQFTGVSAVRTLDNLNPLAYGHDITTNTVDLVQYRVDGGPWVNGNRYGGYSVSISQNIAAASTATVELRTMCEETGVSSRIVRLAGPEVTVLGNGVSILDGAATPRAADGTDFGLAAQGGGPVSYTFTVRNDGTATLTLGAVSVPAGFVLIEGLSPSLAAGASDTFTVQLSTTTVGTWTGGISFATNDPDENPFDFTVTGTVGASGTPQVTVAVAPSAVAEDGAAHLVYTFTRSGVASSALTVNFSVGGTAAYGTDYTATGAASFTATSGTVIIPADQTRAQVIVDPTADTTAEPADETVLLTVAGGTGYAAGIPAAATGTILNDDGSANLALGQPAVASSVSPNLPASNVTDGNLSSYWTSEWWDDQWIYVDLGSVHAIHRIVLEWELAYARSYKLQVSDDTTTWSDAYITTAGDGGVDDITLSTPAMGRYVRMLGTQRATIFGYCLYEFQVYGSGGDAPQITVLGNGRSIAQGDTTPSADDGTDFGLVPQGATVSRTFTVRNDGLRTLTLGTGSGPVVAVPAGFSLTEDLAASLAPGLSDTFTVQLQTATTGTRTGEISFATNDPDENPCRFTVAGTITSATPDVTVIVAPSGVAEDGAANLVYTFTRTGATGSALTVNFSVGGTATFGTDYTQTGAASFSATAGTVTIPAGASSAMVTVDPTADTAVEPDETVLLTVAAGTGYTVGTPAAATGTIQNDEGSVNLALGKPAVASSVEDSSLPAANATDGSLYTRWSSLFADPQWIYVDLGSVQTINRIVLRWETAYGRSYQLQVSTDAATWLTAYSTTTGDGEVDDITLSAPATGRYVRMLGTQRGTMWGYSLYEFEVYGGGVAGPEVTVLGNGVSIADGDPTAGTADGTDFGSVAQGGAAVSRTFTVRNDGTASLTLGPVTVPTGFTLTEGLATTLAAGASDTFTVRLDTATVGTKTGEISFTTNDSDENPFNFTITGIVTTTAVPEVTVLGNGVSIADGDPTAGTADGTDFGSVAQGGAAVSRTFTVRNDGTASLTLGPVTVPTGFTLTEGLAATLAAGASDTFTVRLDTATVGTKTGEISFTTNDSDENPFNFTITGIVTPGTSENLALGKPAVASSVEDSGLPAANATDGSLYTRWSSLFADPQWIYVDLGSVQTINRIVLRWETAYGRSYQLQVSTDAATWLTVYSTTTGDGEVDDITLSAPATGRYVRMLGTQRGTMWGYSLYEFEVYGGGGGSTPVVTAAVAPAAVTEDGATNLVYTFTRTGATGSALTVNFSVGGTATFGTDYTQTGAASFSATAGTVTIPAGASSATVTVDPTADTAVEPDETVLLTVAAGTGYTVGTPAAATGTIQNDEGVAVTATVAVAPAAVTEDGATNLVYTFTRTGATGSALTVNFSVGGTATLGTDYTQTGAASFSATAGTVTIPAGASSATVTVDPTADTAVEPDETVLLTVVAGTGYTVGTPAAATGTIQNDEGAVNLALGQPAVASSTQGGLVASNVTDGDLATRWSSLRSDPQWIYVDLGSVQTINRIVLRWETAYGRSYQLQVSTDAATWLTVYSTTTGDGEVDDITLSAPATGRYVRMLGTQRGTKFGYSLSEFEVYA